MTELGDGAREAFDAAAADVDFRRDLALCMVHDRAATLAALADVGRMDRCKTVVDQLIADVKRDAKGIERARTTPRRDSFPVGGIEPPGPEAEALDPMRCTDAGNAARLVLHGRGQFLQLVHSKRWLTFQPRGTWAPDVHGDVTRAAIETARSWLVDAYSEPDGDRRERMARWSRTSESHTRLRAAVELSASLGLSALDHEFDADPWLLGTPDGVVDLRTASLLPPDPAHRVTKVTGARWRPGASYVAWEAFLVQVLPDLEQRNYLRRWCGYLLSGSVREHALLLLLGDGSNGKSVFITTIQHVLGGYAVTAPPELLLAKHGTDHPTELARLQGARAAFTVEVEEGRRWNESRLKQLTGGDVISARVMRGDWYDYQPSAKLLIAANHSPQVRGTDHGVWRRMRVLRFPITIEDDKQDKALPAKLRAESAGILQWMTQGYQEWQRMGLADPASIRAAVDEYKATQDWCGGFLAARCNVAPGFRVGATPLLEAAQDWCAANGHDKPSAKLLANRLKDRGFESCRFASGPYKGRSAWDGLTLNTNGGEG